METLNKLLAFSQWLKPYGYSGVYGGNEVSPLQDAQMYSDIYSAQDELYTVQQQVVADVMCAAALRIAQPEGVNLSPAQIDELTDRIGMVQMRLFRARQKLREILLQEYPEE